MMTTFGQVNARLRRKNRSRYALLAGCSFFSVMLITAYVTIMWSPTVQTVLPEGGDSRKQVMMVFVLTVLGCAIFTTYAAGLFFREKSRETGIFLALGATRQQLAGEMRKELSLVALVTCVGGILAGIPLAWGIWQFFRLFLVNTEEMVLTFAPSAWLFALAFALFVTVTLFVLGSRSIRRTNIIDVVQESHKSEPIRPVPRYYGWLGIVLLVIGALLGYFMPSFFVLVMHWYAPGVVNAVFYLPALVGLYMILLHTVANGWGGRRKKYKDIISVSMMKFQGRQTVRNMVVMTVLLAGAYFAAFYTPMLGTSALMTFKTAPIDYLYQMRDDQDLVDEADVRALADDHGVSLTSWGETTMARLAVDGEHEVEKDNGALGTTYDVVYNEIEASNLFMSESGYKALSGETVDVAPGTIAPILTHSGDDGYAFQANVSLVTNTITGQQWPVTVAPEIANDSLYGRYVLDDGDFAAMSAGLPDDWRETIVAFNVKNVDETYAFANDLFGTIIAHSDEKVAVDSYWDPVVRERDIAEKGVYYNDPSELEKIGEAIDYDDCDGSDFRMSWQYMPHFRIMDKSDMITNLAVFMMLFIFVAIICFVAVCVIGYTRCLSIAYSNEKVYDDLRHLGAPHAYLRHSSRSQVRRVFSVPAIVGTVIIYLFYALIMYGNDGGKYTTQELIGMAACFLVIAVLSLVIAAVYRATLKRVNKILKI